MSKHFSFKVKKISENSLDSIPSPSLLVKIQIMGGKDIKAKHRMVVFNKLFVFKRLLTTTRNVLSLHLKQTFTSIIWIFTEGEGIEWRLFSEIFFTLNPLDKKLVNAITVYWRGVQVTANYIPTCGGLWTKFRQSSKLSLRCVVLSTNVQFEFVRSVWNGQPFFIVSSQWGEIFFRKILYPLTWS